MIPVLRIPMTAALVSIAVLFSFAAQAQTNRVTFSADFDKMIMYGDYGGERAFALPETIELSKAGQPLPPGTRLVLEVYNSGTLTDYFVMEKGEGWGLDFTAEQRTGDWHFQQYDSNRQVRRTSFAERCQSCHQGAAKNDFMFTRGRMEAYIP